MSAPVAAGKISLVNVRAIARSILIAAAMLIGPAVSNAQTLYGPFGPEGPRMREQFWIVPGAEPDTPLRATVFRPQDDGIPRRRPLVVINHGSDASTREAVAMPVFYWLSRWFVSRGYVVLVPQRRGHGATGGDFAEGRDSCARPDHYQAGQTAADDIEAAVRFMARLPFIDGGRIVVAGTSTGGWASLAVAGRDIPGVRLIVNFAGGRGGHAYGRPRAICARDQLIEAAGRMATRATATPTVWFYAKNDSYFGPDLADGLAKAWRGGGGTADLVMLPSYGSEGHELVSDRGSWSLWENQLAAHLEILDRPERDAIIAETDIASVGRTTRVKVGQQ